jgi:hypothetical protein
MYPKGSNNQAINVGGPVNRQDTRESYKIKETNLIESIATGGKNVHIHSIKGDKTADK